MRIDVGASRGNNGFKTVDIAETADFRVDMNTSRIPIGDNQVDFLNSSHLLEHLHYEAVDATLSEFHRILKDDGLASIVVPDTDSNSFWKGFIAHLDMRMNRYFFRSISRQDRCLTQSEDAFMVDYNGHAFGGLQSYYPAEWDFEVLWIKSFHLYKFCLLDPEILPEVERLYNNTVDQFRVFMKKPVQGRPLTSFDYWDSLKHYPDYEIGRDIDYVILKLRRYTDISLALINRTGVVKDWGHTKSVVHFDYPAFVEDGPVVLERVLAEAEQIKGFVNEVLQQPGRNVEYYQSKLAYIDERVAHIQELGPLVYARTEELRAHFGMRSPR